MSEDFFPNKKDMTAEDFKEFRKLLDFEELDSLRVCAPFAEDYARAVEIRMKICKRMKDFCRKHGNPEEQARLHQDFRAEFVPFIFSFSKEWDSC